MDSNQSLTMGKYGLLLPDTRSKYFWHREGNSVTHTYEFVSKRRESINSPLKKTGRNIDSYIMGNYLIILLHKISLQHITLQCFPTTTFWGVCGEGGGGWAKKSLKVTMSLSLIIPSFFKKLLFQIDEQWMLYCKFSWFNCNASGLKVIWQLVPLKTLGWVSQVQVFITK